MRKLPKPLDENGVPFVPEEVFDLCISKIRNADLKTRLEGIRHHIKKSAANYDVAAQLAGLYQVPRESHIGAVDAEEMIGIYTKRMAKAGRPGRPVYDRIINSPKNWRCPLCDLGTVNTLDHHLPKARYPIFSVTPNNLIPSCLWCQGAKKESSPENAGDQTIHPYFDDFESTVWLGTKVVESVPAAFHFFVRTPAHWDGVICNGSIPILRSSNCRSFMLPTRAVNFLAYEIDLIGFSLQEKVKRFGITCRKKRQAGRRIRRTHGERRCIEQQQLANGFAVEDLPPNEKQSNWLSKIRKNGCTLRFET